MNCSASQLVGLRTVACCGPGLPAPQLVRSELPGPVHMEQGAVGNTQPSL